MKADDSVYPWNWVDTQPSTGEQVVREQFCGLTVRDHIAIQAMQGIIACDAELSETPQSIAMDAYELADAMILESQKVT